MRRSGLQSDGGAQCQCRAPRSPTRDKGRSWAGNRGVGDLGGTSRWARPCPPHASSRLPSGPAPPRRVARRTPRPHLLPRGPGPRPQPEHPRQGCQGPSKSVLATITEVPSYHRTLTAISLIIGVEKCQLIPKGPRRPALTRGAWLKERGGGASLIVVLSLPEQLPTGSSYWKGTNFEKLYCPGSFRHRK